MSSKKQKNNEGSYAKSFKPSIVYGMPTSAEMANQVFLAEQEEVYDSNQNQMQYSSLGYDETSGNPDAMSIFVLKTKDTGVQPNLRPVTVRGKSDFTHSFLIEAAPNTIGVSILLLKQVDNENEIYCNVRYLPYSTLSDITTDTAGDIIQVTLPDTNIVKLNVTLKPTTTGEVLFRTHKTEVDLENTTNEEVIRLKGYLEIDGANTVAFLASQILETESDPNNSQAYTISLSAEDLALPDWITKERVLTGALIVGVVITGSSLAVAIASGNVAGAVFSSLSLLVVGGRTAVANDLIKIPTAEEARQNAMERNFNAAMNADAPIVVTVPSGNVNDKLLM